MTLSYLFKYIKQFILCLPFVPITTFNVEGWLKIRNSYKLIRKSKTPFPSILWMLRPTFIFYFRPFHFIFYYHINPSTSLKFFSHVFLLFFYLHCREEKIERNKNSGRILLNFVEDARLCWVYFDERNSVSYFWYMVNVAGGVP